MNLAEDPGLLAAIGQVRRIVMDDQPLEGTLAAIAQIATSLIGVATGLSVAGDNGTTVSHDMAGGVPSSWSTPLRSTGRVIGTLDLHAETPGAPGEREVELAQAFASCAAVAVVNAQAMHRSQALCGQLREATKSRATIEQAKGILIGQRRCTADEAFGVLRDLSQSSNRKLRDVAEALVDTAFAATQDERWTTQF